MPVVLFLMGPTAVGKTALAVALHHHLPVEVISVDSTMVYRGLDIGSGKPEPEVLSQVPHRLIDIREPQQAFSAAEFCREAQLEIDAIHAMGRIPLLVGGTGLYFRALRDGLAPLPAADPEIRGRLAQDALKSSWGALHQRLAEVDPVAADRILATDSQRIQRALEVYELTGEPISVLQSKNLGACPHPVHSLILECASRDWLHQRIEQRFMAMLEAGLVEEVRGLFHQFGANNNLPALRSVGYRQVIGYLNREYDYPEMVAKSLAATRQLARRQLTWLRKEPPSLRLNADTDSTLEQALEWAQRVS
jgi:tRNA dimethylallyltransferase